jgi:methionine-rich copper-binding protein CopC
MVASASRYPVVSVRQFTRSQVEEEVHMSTQRKFIFLAASAVLILSGDMAAFAHAQLVRATPAVGGTVHEAPTAVTLRFSEKLEPKFSSVVVRDATGKQVDKGDSAVDKADRMVHTRAAATVGTRRLQGRVESGLGGRPQDQW